ncbi:MAG: helix-turn-helix domain-containing protein [Egibacteraceae bacterium]
MLVVGGDGILMEALTHLLLAAQVHAVHARVEEIAVALDRCRPQTLLLDGQVAPQRFAECVALARWHCPQVRLLVLAPESATAGAVADPHELGADGVLSAWSTPQELLAAVNGVTPTIPETQRPVEQSRGPGLTGRLTTREMQILRTLMCGASNTQVAELLRISPNTVRTHVQNILGKLNARTRLEAVTLGFRHGLHPLPDNPTARSPAQ